VKKRGGGGGGGVVLNTPGETEVNAKSGAKEKILCVAANM